MTATSAIAIPMVIDRRRLVPIPTDVARFSMLTNPGLVLLLTYPEPAPHAENARSHGSCPNCRAPAIRKLHIGA